MTMRRYIQAVCVLSTLAFASIAHADDAAIAEAQARFNEGLSLADNAKYDEARLKFLQAVVVLKAPAVLFNLASTEMKTGHDVEAIEHYRGFLKVGANDTRITDAMREKAKQNIAELLRKVAQIEVEAPDGAKISVDGKPLDESPKEPVPVTPGKHTIEASHAGKIKSVTVDGMVGEVAKAKLDFAGDDTTTASPSSGEEAERTTAGWVVPITLGVLGVGGVVMGGVMASSAASSKDDAVNLRKEFPGLCSTPPSNPAKCTEYQDKFDTAESQSTLAWVGYVSGGVLLAASVATFVFWPKSGKSPSASRGMLLTPLVGPQVAGGSLKLQF
jgi:hypothetical protein